MNDGPNQDGVKLRKENELKYIGKDEALVPLHEHIRGLSPVASTVANDSMSFEVEAVEISMPIHLDTHDEGDGKLSLSSSPPVHYLETGFESSYHQMNLVISKQKAE